MFRNEDRTPFEGTGGQEIEWTRDRSVAIAVVRAIAEAKDCDPVQIESIHGSLDVDAIEGIFASDVDDDVVVSFVHDGTRVVVRGDGTVVVRPVTPESGSRTT